VTTMDDDPLTAAIDDWREDRKNNPPPTTPRPNVCILCWRARRIGEGQWLVGIETPPGCDHETVDGRT
jgi:hypothetical protein